MLNWTGTINMLERVNVKYGETHRQILTFSIIYLLISRPCWWSHDGIGLRFHSQVFVHAQRDVFGQMTKHPPAMKPVEQKLQVNHARSRTVPRSKSNAFLWQSITELNTKLMVYFSLTWVWVESNFWLTLSEAFFDGWERVLLHGIYTFSG